MEDLKEQMAALQQELKDTSGTITQGHGKDTEDLLALVPSQIDGKNETLLESCLASQRNGEKVNLLESPKPCLRGHAHEKTLSDAANTSSAAADDEDMFSSQQSEATGNTGGRPPQAG